jgi:hypothetical protein
MTTDETIPYLARIMVCTIDPDGADRDLSPDPDFPTGSILMITNRGENAIVFDPLGLNMAIGGGDKNFFVFDGTNWG